MATHRPKGLSTCRLSLAATFNKNASCAVKDLIFSIVPLCVCVTQLLPACCLEEHIPRHSGHQSEGRAALIRRCHLLGAGIDLAWREQRSDSPATKIRAFRRQEERLTPPPPFAHKCTHTQTQTQSQKEQSVRVHARSYGLSLRIWLTGLWM